MKNLYTVVTLSYKHGNGNESQQVSTLLILGVHESSPLFFTGLSRDPVTAPALNIIFPERPSAT